ncbi:hypothetical protein B296_00015967, partial [Ensete ventricosum]
MKMKKERAFEEEGELGEPRHELVSTPFLDPDQVSQSLDNPDLGSNGEESRKEENLEARGSGQATTRVAKELVVSFNASSTTPRPSSSSRSTLKVEDVYGLRRVHRRRPEASTAFDVFVAFFAECHRQGDKEKRRRHRR